MSKGKHSLVCPECGHMGNFYAEVGGHRPTFDIDYIDPDDPKHSLSKDKDLEIGVTTCWGCLYSGPFDDFYNP